MPMKQTLQNANRIKEILSLTAIYGFGHLINLKQISPILGFGKKFFIPKMSQEYANYSEPERLRMLLEDLGPTFIKIGQFLSSRSDLLDSTFIEELSKLKDNVKVLPFEEMKNQFEHCFGQTQDEIYAEFDKKPIAAASIAQVYKAKLKGGENVAVKIKRPDTNNIIAKDLSVIQMLAGLIEKYAPDMKRYNLVELAEEFSEQFKKEADLILEANYMDKFKNFFRDDNNIIIPEVYWNYTSENIITMSYHKGYSILSLPDTSNFDKQKIAETGMNFYMRQFFELGFFHGDPHSGNFLVTEDNKLIVVDFGIIGKVDRPLLKHISNILSAIIEFDVDKIIDEMISYGVIRDEENYNRKLRDDLIDILLPIHGKSLNAMDFSQVINGLLKISHKYNLYFHPNYMLIIKSLVFMESIGKKLNPAFNFFEFCEPYINKNIYYKYNLQNLMSETFRFTKEYFDLAERLPRDYSKFTDKLLQDKLTVNFMHKGLDKFSGEMDKSINRLSFSILIAAIILASSLLIFAGVGPDIFGVPIFGLLGFLSAGFLGIGLAIAILKSGKF